MPLNFSRVQLLIELYRIETFRFIRDKLIKPLLIELYRIETSENGQQENLPKLLIELYRIETDWTA